AGCYFRRWRDSYFDCVPHLIGRKYLLYKDLSVTPTGRKEQSDGETFPCSPGRVAGRCRRPAGVAAGRAAPPGNLPGTLPRVAVASRAAAQRPALRAGLALRLGGQERRGHRLPARP